MATQIKRRIKTPLLVPIPDDFDAYLKSISKSARYEYKHRAELSYEEIPFDRVMVTEWMDLWARQTVYGKSIQWAPWTTPEIFEKLGVKVFFSGAAMQLLEICGDYAYAQPVMYDKEKYPLAARFMWFELIRWCCGKVKYLDLDGGNKRTWREALKNRKRGSKGYKWLYVPKEIKNSPDAAPEWIVFVCPCGWKTLGYEHSCSRCAS